MKIWKFNLPKSENDFYLRLPKRAKILTLQYQGNIGACIWAEVPAIVVWESRRFRVFDTGTDYDEDDIGWNGKYIGTWQQGPHVWHLFEVIN